MRYEKKIISELSLAEILNLIKLHPAMFREQHPDRIINNIYFDTIDLKNYNEHINGISKREKIRLRWYGNKINNVKLEIKQKENESGNKLSFSLNKIPKWLKEKLKGYKISLRNSYLRKYFISVNKKQRITVDISLNQPIIIEFKYSENEDVCNFFPERVAACSKYVNGVENRHRKLFK